MKTFLLFGTGLLSATAWVSTPVQRQRVGMTTVLPSRRIHHHHRRGWQLKATDQDHELPDFMKDKRFESLDTELPYSDRQVTGEPLQIASRRRIVLPAHHHEERTTILASSTYAAPTTAKEMNMKESSTAEASEVEEDDEIMANDEADPYASEFDSQMEKVNSYAERVERANRRTSLGDRIKSMDLQDIISTLFVPAIALYAAGRWAFTKVSKRVGESTDAVLDSFAREMIYHDGDFDEMELCFKDYSRKLVFLGPSKTDTMLKTYLESYAKKKTVSPQAVVSLSYVFTLAKLSEERAAKILVSLCRQMGAEKMSSAGKLLFLGSRILKSPEGKRALEPIKDLIKGTYRDGTVAENLVETSQQAIAEASYRAAVHAGGKGQTFLTAGWEVLGLDEETAQRIFQEEAKEGFVSDREAHYGRQTQKYDKMGHRLNKDGTLEDPAEAQEAAKAKEDENVSNVYECSQCGYTLFVAQGRETKFFGPDFKCPECGAPKEKFEPRDDFGKE